MRVESRALCVGTALVSLLFVSAPIGAVAMTTASFAPAADTTIFHGGSTSFDDVADGSGAHVWTSTLASGSFRRALLRFDLSSIPPGAVIREVRLTLYQSRSRTEHPVAVHRLLSSWGEGASNGGDAGVGAAAQTGDATWIRRLHPGAPWAAPGGDFAVALSTSRVVPNVAGLFVEWPSTPAMVADVQQWVDAPASNHGWILIGDEVNSQSAKRFSSRNESAAAVRPRLVVDYEPAPAPGAADGEVPFPPWVLLSLAGLLAAGLARRRVRQAT